MAAMSRGPGAKPTQKLKPKTKQSKDSRRPRHVKGGTVASTRSHVFKGFSQRIAQLKIEPVRRGRSTILDDAELEATFSYFRDAFVEWREINMSEAFTGFAREVAPLCDSLPQVLHHSDRIVNLLLEYIERGEKFSQEPLLSLIAHLAHDLGERFEAHFERVVRTVSRQAATHTEVEVIEWSFGCLAWLFKYLSRLLVPDLRPVIDLMWPLLGTEQKKGYISRFAAESLSFLIRKAGAIHHRDKTPLKLIVGHISKLLQDRRTSGQDDQFEHGLMYLLADSLKSVQRTFHSSAVPILQELLIEEYSEEHIHVQHPPLESILKSVITAALHHSDSENFEPVLKLVLAHIDSAPRGKHYLGLSSRLLFVVCGVRKGDRISDWKSTLNSVENLLNSTEEFAEFDPIVAWELLVTVSVVFQYCKLDAAILHERLLEKLARGHWERLFLPFCDIFAKFGAERFRTLLLPYFKKFVMHQAQNYGQELCAVVTPLYETGTLSNIVVQPSDRWQSLFHDPFETLQQFMEDEECSGQVYYCNALLNTFDILHVPQENLQSARHCLQKLLERALKIKDLASIRIVDTFATGNGLRFLIGKANDDGELTGLWLELCEAAALYGHSLMFWHALLAFLQRNKGDVPTTGQHMEVFKRALIRCLSSSSHDMRLIAIYILEIIAGQSEKWLEIISVAKLIEQTPLNLENQRPIAIRIEQLSRLYPALCSDPWIGEAMPAFCMGLLHVKMASVCDNSSSALKAMCETREGEDFIARIVFEWIGAYGEQEGVASEIAAASSQRRYVDEFECLNLIELQEHAFVVQSHADDMMHWLGTIFNQQHIVVPYDNSRTQAFRLLNSMPSLAEKRSRQLVSFLIDWAQSPSTKLGDTDGFLDEAVQRAQNVWPRKEQKAMLSVFAKFSNPKVLYRAEEVRAALFTLLSNGDVEIQKAALKALLAWKDPAVIPYQESLMNLLDDARFRDELPLFLSDGELHEKDIGHVLPIVLRLLYGKVIAGNRGLETKRKAVFMGLKNKFGDQAIIEFLNIALGPLSNLSILSGSSTNEGLLQTDLMELRKQLGMLHLVEDLLSTFQSTFSPFTETVLDPLLYCVIRAARNLAVETKTKEPRPQKTSLLRTIRQRGLQTLGRMFESCPGFAWQTRMCPIIEELVKPRLELLPIETAQSVSGLLRLFAAWSTSLHTAPFLVEFDQNLLIKIIDCLEVESAKDEVKCFVLDDILRTTISLVVDEDDAMTIDDKLNRNRIFTNLIQPYSNAILSKVGNLLRKSPSKTLLESGVMVIADLAPHVTGSMESRSMIEIAAFLLRQPSKRVGPRTKQGLLKIIHEFIQRCNSTSINALFNDIFDTICPLFAFVQDHTSRSLVCGIFQELSNVIDDRGDLVNTANLCHDLNSFASGRLNEPDFERRLKAFNAINEQGYQSYTIVQWKPLIYNLLYYIKDADELSIRLNASLSLRRFIEVSSSDDFMEFISKALLPGIQLGVKETSELVQAEFLVVLEQLVKIHRDWTPVSDLSILLSEDEESSFFSNILHIQGHRRLRALQRLAANGLRLQGGNIYQILIPLLEHFVFNKADDEGADSLLGETIKTLAALSEGLEWPQFRSLLHRYIGYLTSKEDMQKQIIKLIAGLMDALNRAGRAKGYVVTRSADQEGSETSRTTETASAQTGDVRLPTLARTLPQQEKLTNDLKNHFLPTLTEFLHKKDEATVSLRVPIAIAVTKVLLVLPPREIETRLPAVLLDICYILKSRAQESRDMSRNTLCDVATIMGPVYLGFILKALRTALQRGYQLHVLSFTLHHILVRLLGQLQPGDLDYCLGDIVDVIMDDTFGMTGQEKDAEEYISKMKEVKSSKSFDSMDIVARSATPAHIIKLILPIKVLLTEKLNAKMVQKVDELLRRIGLGVLQNPTVKDRSILVFCYELIKEAYAASTSTEKKAKVDYKTKRFLINGKGAAKSGARLSTSSYLYKLIRFGLDMLRTVLRKHDELQTPQNVHGFLPIVGDAMVQGQEEVQVSAIRLLIVLVKLPMAELDSNYPVYLDEAMRTIRGAPSSNTELAQASLKLMSACIQERPGVQVKERDVGHVLKRMIPDLDQPDRSGVTFGFLKAVMNRRFDVPEIYEAMDKVAEMMVTNQTKSARDVARSHYYQFLTSYTQSEKRFKKQMEFLLKNLRYEYVEGRQSVMEALDLIISKALPRFPEKAQYEYHGMIFLPLINTLANDNASKCREMASLLMKRLFQYASEQRLHSFSADFKAWLEQDENTGLKRLGIQCWGFYFEALEGEDEPKELSFVLNRLDEIIDECLTRRDEEDWELLYFSLTLLSKVCKKYPNTMFASTKESLWIAIQASASYPHAWVKLKAADLVGTYFAHLGMSNKDTGLEALPLHGSGGLQLAEQNMIQLANAFLKNLLNPHVTEQLCMQSVKNLAFLARCLAVNGARWHWQKADDQDEDMDDDDGDGDDVIDKPRDDDATSSGSEFGGFSPPPEEAKLKKEADNAPPAAIHRLVVRLSSLVRRDTTSPISKTATMMLLDTLTSRFPLDPLTPSLPHLLSTLNTLVDPSTTTPRAATYPGTPNDAHAAHTALVDKAREILVSLQKRLGTQEYLRLMSEVQKRAREKREERRRKRRVEAVADPEKWGREKRRRNEGKREKRKERGVEMRGRRRGW